MKRPNDDEGIKRVAPTPHILKINIQPESAAYSTFAHLPYKPAHALAEFVDNSVQSFQNNKLALEEIHGSDFKLEIRISYDNATKTVEIRDNAGGINTHEYPNAFKVAAAPRDRSGLNEFGMGMKTAACWFSDKWSVRTKALGEDYEREFRMNVREVASKNIIDLPVTELPRDRNDHYTIIRLENTGERFPQTLTRKKIKEHLSSIYRMQIRSGEYEIFVGEDDSPLTWEEPAIMFLPPAATPNLPKVKWRKDINFKLDEVRSVSGFAAIYEKGGTSKGGFALIRRGRLIMGGDSESPYAPEEIFGKPNDFRRQRVFGELHLEGFDVSHTKDAFTWGADLEQLFLQKLREQLKTSPFDILDQAVKARVKSKVPNDKELAQRSKKTVKELSQTYESPSVAETIVSTPEQESESNSAQSQISVDVETTQNINVLSLEFEGKKWKINMITRLDENPNHWIAFRREGDHRKFQDDGFEESIDILLFLKHPALSEYLVGKSEKGMKLLNHFALSIGLTCLKLERMGKPISDLLMSLVNDHFKDAFSHVSE
jgi:hypothetical protein